MQTQQTKEINYKVKPIKTYHINKMLFHSLEAVASYLNCTKQTANYWLKKGITKKGEQIRVTTYIRE